MTNKVFGPVSIILASAIAAVLSTLAFANVANADPVSLAVNQITPVATSAIADGTFQDGWKYVFDITVPSDETSLAMEFGDWTDGSDTIPAAGNMQIYSAQSSNASDEADAIAITNSSTYSAPLDLVIPDNNEIQVTVEVAIPVGSAAGSYSTTYGIDTENPNQSSTPATSTPPVAPNITSVDSLTDINVANGTASSSIGLPTSVGVGLSDGTTSTASIVWDGGTPAYDANTSGAYVFAGTLTPPSGDTNTSNLSASQNVIVAAPVVATSTPVAPTVTMGFNPLEFPTVSTMTPGQVISFNANASDTDPTATITYALSADSSGVSPSPLPANATIDSSGNFSWDTTSAPAEFYDFYIVASGSTGGSTYEEFMINMQ